MARRRVRGEGSICRLADGRYKARICLDGRVHATHVRTQREAASWLASLRSRARAGVDVTDRSTLAAFLGHWLETARPGLRHNTWVLYDQVIRDHVVPFVGAVRLDALRPDHIQRLYADRQVAGVSAWTVRKVHVCLHRALGRAAVWGLVVRNVADLVDSPARPRGAVAALQPDEVQRLLMAAVGERCEWLFYLAIVSGMRLGELLGLRWSDIDWERGAVSVCRQLCRQHRGGGLSFEPVKTVAGNRLVVLGADGLAALRDQRRRLDNARLLAGSRWSEGGLIFPSSVGTPLEPRRVYAEFQRVLASAGVRRVRFHDLRHTSASLALRGGVPAKVISERLGHSGIGITLDLYSHVADELQGRAAQILEEQVRPIRVQLPAG